MTIQYINTIRVQQGVICANIMAVQTERTRDLQQHLKKLLFLKCLGWVIKHLYLFPNGRGWNMFAGWEGSHDILKLFSGCSWCTGIALMWDHFWDLFMHESVMEYIRIFIYITTTLFTPINRLYRSNLLTDFHLYSMEEKQKKCL